MKKNAILLINFGTKELGAKEQSLDQIEKVYKNFLKNFDVYSAFTSAQIINQLEKDNIKILNPEDALKYLIYHKYNAVLMQPTQIIPSNEYEKVLDLAQKYKDSIKIVIGNPLLFTDRDFERVSDFLVDTYKDYLDEGKYVLLMGHGTEDRSKHYYEYLNQFLTKKANNIKVEPIENSDKDFDSLSKELKEKDISEVVLSPFMILYDDQEKENMINNENSWNNRLQDDGISITVLEDGLGSYDAIQKHFLVHTLDLLNKL